MFSRFLWFIPTGNSEKSLPYLLDVMRDGDQYQDVARYLYGILLLEDPALRPEAVKQLTWLVSHYPANGRFQLRLISLLLIMNDFEGTLNAISNYLEKGHRPAEPELSITKILKARAYLGLNETELAANAFSEINSVFLSKRDGIPDWGVAWYLLTDGQVNDLANRRDQAIAAYRQLLSMAKETSVSDPLIEAARAGLSEPYRLRSDQ
jgi:tetratricopeptide (TPR) repeat protein